jgi:hypothetical protein
MCGTAGRSRDSGGGERRRRRRRRGEAELANGI